MYRCPQIIFFTFSVPPFPLLLCWCLIVAGIVGIRREERHNCRKKQLCYYGETAINCCFNYLWVVCPLCYSLSPVVFSLHYSVQEQWNHHGRSCKWVIGTHADCNYVWTMLSSVKMFELHSKWSTFSAGFFGSNTTFIQSFVPEFECMCEDLQDYRSDTRKLFYKSEVQKAFGQRVGNFAFPGHRNTAWKDKKFRTLWAVVCSFGRLIVNMRWVERLKKCAMQALIYARPLVEVVWQYGCIPYLRDVACAEPWTGSFSFFLYAFFINKVYTA